MMGADYVFLSGDQVPDFRTLNTFRTRHMVDFKHLAIDGQKIPANASFRNTLDRAGQEAA
jgi:hypothetical protein